MFGDYIWKYFILFHTALMFASYIGSAEIIKMLVKQEGIDINAKDIYLCLSIFILII